MRTHRDLRPYQRRLARRMYREPALGLFVDPGLGKTSTTLYALRGLLRGGHTKGAVVVGPINVVETVWEQEAAVWQELTGLRFVLVRGRPKERLRLLREPADVYLINFELLQWLSYLETPLPDTLIIDESDYIKAVNTQRFKSLRYRLLKRFDRRYILTGTPTPNTLMDLWTQIYVLDNGKRLGRSFTVFKQRFFEQTDYHGFKWAPRPGAEDRIMALTRDIVVRLDQEDYITVPKVITHIERVELPDEVRRLYDEHEREMFIQLGDAEIEAFNAATLTMHCHQLANGAIYDDPEDRASWTEVHDSKILALERLLADGRPTLVPYWFRHDLARLRARWPDALWIGGKGAPVRDVVARWNRSELPVVFIHPASAAHGLNMQFGSGNRIIWFSNTWSAGKRHQLIKRLARSGSQYDHVSNVYLVARDTVDEVIIQTADAKERGQRLYLDALRAYQRRKQSDRPRPRR